MSRCGMQMDGAIALYFYDELEAAEQARVAQHLTGCAACREALEEMGVIRAALATRPDVSAPSGGDWTAFMTRLDAATRADVRRAAVRPSSVGYLAMAALLVLVTISVLFVQRSRERAVVPAPPDTTIAISPPQSAAPGALDPQLASMSERHLERSRLVVLGMAAKDAAHFSDWQYERELAAGLLNDTRLYRITAEQRGMTRLAGVLRDLEIVLLQTSLTEEKDPAALQQIQRLIDKRDLVEQMETVRTEGN